MIHLNIIPHLLYFKNPLQTAKKIYTQQTTYFIQCYDDKFPQQVGWGEASPIPQSSLDEVKYFEQYIKKCEKVLKYTAMPQNHYSIFLFIQKHIPLTLPALQFGLEIALLDFINGGKRIWCYNDFTLGKKNIQQNTLISIDTYNNMLNNAIQKIQQGYMCIKIKIKKKSIGLVLNLLDFLKNNYPNITIRLDANGDFDPKEILQVLYQLTPYNIQAIEQPIAPQYHKELQILCRNSPIPIALDESLINANKKILQIIRPQYIVLKPVYLGGLYATKLWISTAEKYGISWWVTAGLESNLGLNAILQFVGYYSNDIVHGLDTYHWYNHNIDIDRMNSNIIVNK